MDDVDRPAPEDELPKNRAPSVLDLKITLKDLEDFGHTEVGCERCDYIKEHGDARRSVGVDRGDGRVRGNE